MTDGETYNVGSNYTPYGIEGWDRRRTPLGTNPTIADLNAATDARTTALCTAIKNLGNNGVTLWVVYYGTTDFATTERMKNCATTRNNHFFQASNTQLLIESFNKIPFLKFVNDREGTSIVEFAVISPVLFTLLFGGFDFGHTLYMQSVLQGAINKAARDSALETGTVEEVQAAVDQKVIDQVTAVHRTAEFDADSFSRSYFRTFTDAAFPESEVWDDTNSDGE
eukprot:gene29762-51799_t